MGPPGPGTRRPTGAQRGLEGITMDTNDRITIRLEPELLTRMDALLEDSRAYGSRSQLCRVALDAFLETVEESSNRVAVEIPRAYLDFLDGLVEAGYFVSREEAARRLIEEGLSRDRVREIIEHRELMGRASGTLFPVDLKKDE